ncbi:MAG: terminase small subunit [Candidatus Binataceae bacterium]
MKTTTPPSKLNARMLRFVNAYLESKNCTAAAASAGYSVKCAHSIGSRLLKKAEIRTAIEQAQAHVANRAEVSVERVVRELAALAFVDPAQFYDEEGNLLLVPKMPEAARRALAGMDVEELFARDVDGKMRPSGMLKKLKFAAKVPALDLLARHLGMLQAPQAATPASLRFIININLGPDDHLPRETPALRIEREEP